MSRQHFDFSPLIRDYSSSFTVVTYTDAGYNKAGEWQKGTAQHVEYTGAIIAHRESKMLRSDGSITAKDKRLFMLHALPQALMGAEVIHKGQKYKIESELENAEFTGVHSYMLKWVSAFDSN